MPAEHTHMDEQRQEHSAAEAWKAGAAAAAAAAPSPAAAVSSSASSGGVSASLTSSSLHTTSAGNSQQATTAPTNTNAVANTAAATMTASAAAFPSALSHSSTLAPSSVAALKPRRTFHLDTLAAADGGTSGRLSPSSDTEAVSPPPAPDSPSSRASQRALQSQVLLLQAENSAVKDELALLRHRLRQIDEHNLPIPPTVTHAGSRGFSAGFSTGASAAHLLPVAVRERERSNVVATGHAALWSEEQAMVAWQQSQELDMPLPLFSRAEQFDAEPLLAPTSLPASAAAVASSTAASAATPASAATAAAAATLHHDVNALLDHLKPSKRSESRRANVLSFLKLLVRKSLGAQVYPLGAFALKTYVGGDEAMDVSAFFSRAHEHTWLHRIVNALCQEAASSHHAHTNAHATSTASPHDAVSELSVSFSKRQPYIHACIGGVHVNIYGNHVQGLSSLALFERMDLMCAQSHLFKRTILLTKCWALSKHILNASRGSMLALGGGPDELTGPPQPTEGLLPGMFLRTLVLFIFNRCASEIRTPLEGLYRLLHFLRHFDWDTNALTVDGAVTLASLEMHGCSAQGQRLWQYVSTGPSAWPAGTKPFLPRETLRQFSISKESKTTATATTMQPQQTGGSLSRTASSSSLSATSAVFQPASQRATSDNIAFASSSSMSAAAAAAVSVAGGAGIGRQVSTAHGPASTATTTRSHHSQSFSSFDSAEATPVGRGHAPLHSQSYTNLQATLSSSPSQPFQPHLLPRSGSRASFVPQDSPARLLSYPASSCSTPNGHDSGDSASVTPSHSSTDLQKLLAANMHLTTGTAAASQQSSVGAIGGTRLGFSSAATQQPALRSSASSVHLNRLPLPVSASSSSLFAHLHGSTAGDGGDYSDEDDSPDGGDDEASLPPQHHGSARSAVSTIQAGFNASASSPQAAAAAAAAWRSSSHQSLAGVSADEDIEGAEYLDANTPLASPLPSEEQELPTYANMQYAPTTAAAVGAGAEGAAFVRCALNLLDPVLPSHNLGASISYRHEYHIRNTFKDAFLELKNSMQRFAFAHASTHMERQPAELPTSPSDADVEMHPVMLELFQEHVLNKFQEQARREMRGRRILAANNGGSRSGSGAALSSMAKSSSVGNDMASLWAPANTSTSSASATLSFSAASFASDVAHAAVSSPSRNLYASSGSSKTGNLIVDDAAVDTSLRNHAMHSSAASAALSSGQQDSLAPLAAPSSSTPTAANTAAAAAAAGSPGVFDSLSGDLDKIVANLSHARQFETPDLSEDQLVLLIIDLLRERVSVPVGRLGSLLHDVTNNHSLPAMLKSTFGGLKSLMQNHPLIFDVGKTHPYNPNVSLQKKWHLYAPQRPAGQILGNTNSGSGSHGVSSGQQLSSGHFGGSNGLRGSELHGGSGGNLASLGGTGNTSPAGDGHNGRRKLQRRRTRTRRTNSGAATASSLAAVNDVRAALSLSSPASDGSHYAAHVQLSPAPMARMGGGSDGPRPALTSVVALDCEMVGTGPSGLNSMLARISLVNFHGELLYDKLVRPTEVVTDYRTSVSGIVAGQLEQGGIEFRQAQREVSQMVKSRLVVGHGLTADLQALQLNIPKVQLRDTALLKLYCPHRPLPLKQLVREHLGSLIEFANFQASDQPHNPVSDARAALALYKLVAQQWEQALQQEAQQQLQHSNVLSVGVGVGGGNNSNHTSGLLAHAQHSHSLPNMMQLQQQHQQQQQLRAHVLQQHQQQQQQQQQQQHQQQHSQLTHQMHHSSSQSLLHTALQSHPPQHQSSHSHSHSLTSSQVQHYVHTMATSTSSSTTAVASSASSAHHSPLITFQPSPVQHATSPQQQMQQAQFRRGPQQIHSPQQQQTQLLQQQQQQQQQHQSPQLQSQYGLSPHSAGVPLHQLPPQFQHFAEQQQQQQQQSLYQPPSSSQQQQQAHALFAQQRVLFQCT